MVSYVTFNGDLRASVDGRASLEPSGHYALPRWSLCVVGQRLSRPDVPLRSGTPRTVLERAD
jgi:hypothetical protein